MANYSREVLSQRAGGLPVESRADSLLKKIVADEKENPSGVAKWGQAKMAGSDRFLAALTMDSALSGIFGHENITESVVRSAIEEHRDRWKKSDPDARMRIMKGYPSDMTGALSDAVFAGAVAARDRSASEIKLEDLAAGLIGVEKSRAMQILKDLGVSERNIRTAILDLLNAPAAPVAPTTPSPAASPTPRVRVTPAPAAAGTAPTPDTTISPALQAAVDRFAAIAIDPARSAEEQANALEAIRKLTTPATAPAATAGPTPPVLRRRVRRTPPASP